jgi:membrane-associated phospholipid phosphatase
MHVALVLPVTNKSAFAFAATSLTATAAFVILSRAVARRDTAAIDDALREKTAAPDGHPVREAAKTIAPLGKWWTYFPAAVGLSALAIRRGEQSARSRIAGAGALIVAASIAAALNPALDDLPQPTAPPGRDSPDKPVFPSGHAFGPGTVALTAAHVLSREELVPISLGLAAAVLVPVVTAGGRLLEEKHWVSDIVGGYLGAIAVATMCLAAYEGVRGSD